MLHHVALETRFEDAEACVAFFALLGFHRVEPPESLGGRAVWLALGDQQVHLLLTDGPVIPRHGHLALVVDDYPATVTRLTIAGYDVEQRRQHWGSPRAFVRDSVGHVVEIMQFPPAG
jgi:catechol 2,3-dioxygenase-like lactoylglutathione lyase family enzyme